MPGPSKDAPLHWRECGLDNIVLLNGFTREIVDGEEFVTVENVEALWKAIGLHLVVNRRTLSPRELRFLRRQMDMTQAELGQLLRVSEQAVARWEKGQCELPGPADFALRTAFLLSDVAQPEGATMVRKLLTILRTLTATPEDRSSPMAFRHSDDRWNEERMLAA